MPDPKLLTDEEIEALAKELETDCIYQPCGGQKAASALRQLLAENDRVASEEFEQLVRWLEDHGHAGGTTNYQRAATALRQLHAAQGRDAGDAATLRGFIKTYGMTPFSVAVERDAAVADRERLDWLWGHSHGHGDTEAGDWIVCWAFPVAVDWPADIRTAIDAARTHDPDEEPDDADA